MPNLDTETLLAVALLVYLVVSALTLCAALYGSRDRTLYCVSAAWFVAGGVGSIINVASQGPSWAMAAIWVTSASLLLMYGLLWAGFRYFVDKPVPWVTVVLGPIAWLVLCLWPVFVHSVTLRVVVFSVVILFYTALSLRDLWPSWRRDKIAVAPVILLLAMNGLFYIARAVPHGSSFNSWLGRPDFTATILENIIFVLGISFSVLVMVRAETERQHEYASLHDDLTGLYNRRAFFLYGSKLLERNHAASGNVVALMCDLDWFKQVNDRYGHNMGDRILKLFAKAVCHSLPDDGMCARLGGEEFLVLFPHAAGVSAHTVAVDIQRRLAEYTNDLGVNQTVSTGIAFGADAGYDLDRLLTHADNALYAAKDAGRNCVNAWSRDLPDVAARPGGGDVGMTRFR